MKKLLVQLANQTTVVSAFLQDNHHALANTSALRIFPIRHKEY